MAESTLSITFSSIAGEFTRQHGWLAFASWTADNTADFSKCLNSGLRKFYFPPNHNWSFLKVYTTLSVSANDYDIDLPDNFSGKIIDDSVTHNVGVPFPPLRKIDEGILRALRSRENAYGPPTSFAVRTKTHAPTTGQRFEILLYPTPDVAYTIPYAYVALPDAITSTNIYPVGGTLYSEVILQAVLSEGERLLDDDTEGPHMKEFNRLMEIAINEDKGIKAVPK